jgi:hypothetical protein
VKRCNASGTISLATVTFEKEQPAENVVSLCGASVLLSKGECVPLPVFLRDSEKLIQRVVTANVAF